MLRGVVCGIGGVVMAFMAGLAAALSSSSSDPELWSPIHYALSAAALLLVIAGGTSLGRTRGS